MAPELPGELFTPNVYIGRGWRIMRMLKNLLVKFSNYNFFLF